MEYVTLFVIIITSILLSIILFSISYFLTLKNRNIEKVLPYECGFEAFENSRTKFEVHFYIVSLLFIIFDLEVMFILPWCVSVNSNDLYSYWIILLFLFILTVGFLYEWSRGALNWGIRKSNINKYYDV